MNRLLYVLALLCSLSAHAQKQFFVQPWVDTSATNVQKAIAFYRSYVESFRHDTLPPFHNYWRTKDMEQYEIPDQMVYGIQGDYPTYSMGEQRSIIYVKPIGDIVHIKTQIGWDADGKYQLLCIANHYVSFYKDGSPYFISPLDMAAPAWQQTRIRNVVFHYPAYHTFDRSKAKSLIANIKMLEHDWQLQPIEINYFFANTIEEIKQLTGFDYTLDMGNADKPSGISNDINNTAFCAGLGENYFHEIVHIYLNRLYPKSPLQEGLAHFYGGSMGKTLAYHKKKLIKYLIAHPEVHVDSMNDLPKPGNNTNQYSTVQAILCTDAYDKGGLGGLQKIMQYESIEAILKEEYGLSNFAAFIDKLKKEYANK
jgi:hypothetical protein